MKIIRGKYSSSSNYPQVKGIRTMKGKVIHRFPIIPTHRASINIINILLPQIIQSKNLPLCSCPSEKSYLRRNFHLPNTLPRERVAIST